MVKANETYLIADTSGLVSMTLPTDRNHEPALTATQLFQDKQTTILVPYEVLVETLNVIGKLVGHEPAVAVAAYIAETPLFTVVDTSKEARAQALERFVVQPAAVSFTDCIVMTVADEYRTQAIFGFDRDHSRNGYAILSPKSANQK